jgi:hypothetical protein
MNPTITISIHGQEETLTLQDAVNIRNGLRQSLSSTSEYFYMVYHSMNTSIQVKDKDNGAQIEAYLTAAINEHQNP